MKDVIVIPYAPVLVESTRSIGYSFESALADIIDNSIGKNANKIDVYFSSIEPQYVAVLDNGVGMDSEELISAMRYGSRSSLDVRDINDLGRFGLGLKTASMSQCRRLTVITKKNDVYSAACWDLDNINETKKWSLITYSDREIKKLKFYKELGVYKTGTVVIWEEFDRIALGSVNTQTTFDEKIEIAREHISLVFHRFMELERGKEKIKIFFNKDEVKPIDPFLTKNPATQQLHETNINIHGENIAVKPYILPFANKIKASEKKKLGAIADLHQNQGFYIYRNKRLIIWGTWFRLNKKYELNKLARIRVDIPNSLDSLWEIDVKKSTASIPDMLKNKLKDIAVNTVGCSERVYRYRGRKVNTDDMVHIWNVYDERGKIQYLINRELPIYKILVDSLDEKGIGYLDTFLKVLEDAFPYGDVYYRMAKDNNSISNNTLEVQQAYKVAEDMINGLKQIGGDVEQFLKNMDKLDFFVKYPDVVKQIREDYKND